MRPFRWTGQPPSVCCGTGSTSRIPVIRSRCSCYANALLTGLDDSDGSSAGSREHKGAESSWQPRSPWTPAPQAVWRVAATAHRTVPLLSAATTPGVSTYVSGYQRLGTQGQPRVLSVVPKGSPLRHRSIAAIPTNAGQPLGQPQRARTGQSWSHPHPRNLAKRIHSGTRLALRRRRDDGSGLKPRGPPQAYSSCARASSAVMSVFQSARSAASRPLPCLQNHSIPPK